MENLPDLNNAPWWIIIPLAVVKICTRPLEAILSYRVEMKKLEKEDKENQ